jgi:hypothetical protein
MKKILITLGVLIGIIIFLYGALAALVNQGLDLTTALTVFFAVILGGAGLIWVLRDNQGTPPPN